MDRKPAPRTQSEDPAREPEKPAIHEPVPRSTFGNDFQIIDPRYGPGVGFNSAFAEDNSPQATRLGVAQTLETRSWADEAERGWPERVADIGIAMLLPSQDVVNQVADHYTESLNANLWLGGGLAAGGTFLWLIAPYLGPYGWFGLLASWAIPQLLAGALRVGGALAVASSVNHLTRGGILGWDGQRDRASYEFMSAYTGLALSAGLGALGGGNRFANLFGTGKGEPWAAPAPSGLGPKPPLRPGDLKTESVGGVHKVPGARPVPTTAPTSPKPESPVAPAAKGTPPGKTASPPATSTAPPPKVSQPKSPAHRRPRQKPRPSPTTAIAPATLAHYHWPQETQNHVAGVFLSEDAFKSLQKFRDQFELFDEQERLAELAKIYHEEAKRHGVMHPGNLELSIDITRVYSHYNFSGCLPNVVVKSDFKDWSLLYGQLAKIVDRAVEDHELLIYLVHDVQDQATIARAEKKFGRKAVEAARTVGLDSLTIGRHQLQRLYDVFRAELALSDAEDAAHAARARHNAAGEWEKPREADRVARAEAEVAKRRQNLHEVRSGASSDEQAAEFAARHQSVRPPPLTVTVGDNFHRKMVELREQWEQLTVDERREGIVAALNGILQPNGIFTMGVSSEDVSGFFDTWEYAVSAQILNTNQVSDAFWEGLHEQLARDAASINILWARIRKAAQSPEITPSDLDTATEVFLAARVQGTELSAEELRELEEITELAEFAAKALSEAEIAYQHAAKAAQDVAVLLKYDSSQHMQELAEAARSGFQVANFRLELARRNFEQRPDVVGPAKLAELVRNRSRLWHPTALQDR